MSESAERTQAGERAGAPCGWCQGVMEAESQAAVCTECSVVHHERCWDDELGCSKRDCVNAPLKRLDAPVRRPRIRNDGSPGSPTGESGTAGRCYACGVQNSADSSFCKKCGAPITEQGAGSEGITKKKKKKKSGAKNCVRCGTEMPQDEQVCYYCNAINTPDGLYHGPRIPAPGAKASMVLGLVGLLVCAPVLGPIAIVKSRSAKELIRRDPRYDGEGLATAGFVLGIIDLVLFGLFVLMKLSSMK